MTNREALLICLTALDAKALARALVEINVDEQIAQYCLKTCARLNGNCPYEFAGDIDPESCVFCLANWLEEPCEDIDAIRALITTDPTTKGDK